MRGKFNFDEKALEYYMIRELKVLKTNSEAFRYIAEKLPNQTELDLSKVEFTEGKNYDWCVIVNGNVTLIIRQYGSHFTIFTKVSIENEYNDKTKYYTTNYGCLMFESSDDDELCDNPYLDLNESISKLIEIVREEKLHVIWNSLSFTRKKRVKVTKIFHGETIDNADLTMFALDEITQKYLELFAENDMLKRISTMKKGDKFGVHTVESVKSELGDDKYYHGVGLHFIDNWDKKQWHDVYALTRWHYEELFPDTKPVENDLIPRLGK